MWISDLMNGEYYIYYGAPDEGVMMVKTKDPFGEWEAPKLIKEAKGMWRADYDVSEA